MPTKTVPALVIGMAVSLGVATQVGAGFASTPSLWQLTCLALATLLALAAFVWSRGASVDPLDKKN